MNEFDLAESGTVLLPFLRSLAHDMAAPLTSTIGYAQLNLEELGTSEEIREDLREIEQSAQRMRVHLRRLSRLSRFIPDETTCPLGELLTDLEHLTRSLAMSAGNEIQWDLQETFQTEESPVNPWIVRVACLAMLGSVCRLPNPVISVTRTPLNIVIKFPADTEHREHSSPNNWGCTALGQRLFSNLPGSNLEKMDEKWSLSLLLKDAD